jgi:cell division protein FtsN
VQVGAYSLRANEEEMKKKLKEAGFNSIIVDYNA